MTADGLGSLAFVTADRELAIATIHELGRRARGDALEGLGHPVLVEGRLHQHLLAATALATLSESDRSDRLTRRDGSAITATQRRFNDEVLGVLHQLDHRSRRTEDAVWRLEQALAAIESRLR